MKYYTRTTHNFNNETREWEYRDLPEWKNISNFAIVHCIDSGYWEVEYHILSKHKEWTISDLGQEAITPDFEEKTKKELDDLVKLDMIRVQER